MTKERITLENFIWENPYQRPHPSDMWMDDFDWTNPRERFDHLHKTFLMPSWRQVCRAYLRTALKCCMQEVRDFDPCDLCPENADLIIEAYDAGKLNVLIEGSKWDHAEVGKWLRREVNKWKASPGYAALLQARAEEIARQSA